MNIQEAISRIKIIYQDTSMAHDLQIKSVIEELHKSAYEECFEDIRWGDFNEEESFTDKRSESEA